MMDALEPQVAGQIPWEQRKELGFFKALWETWIEVLFSPKLFFRKRSLTPSLWTPLLYAMILGTLAAIFEIPSLFGYVNYFPQWGVPDKVLKQWSTGSLITAPLWIALGTWVMAGIYHVGIALLGGKGGYGATFRTFCYATSASVFGVIPWIGGLIASIYTFYLYLEGFQQYHQLSRGRAIGALLLPVLVGFLVVMGVIVLFALLVGGTLFNELPSLYTT
jgi:hypothetical protein